VIPSEGATSFSAFTCNGAIGSTRNNSTSTREILGTASFSNSRRLAASPEVICDMPASRPDEALDEAGPLWIAECDHDNRDCASHVLRGQSGRGGGCDDDVRLEAQTFRDEF